MRSSRAGAELRLALAGALAVLTAACSTRGPAPAELAPLQRASPAHARLPDDAERSAARLAALTLAARPADARRELDTLRELERELDAAGAAPPGLSDNGADLLAAAGPRRAYDAHAEHMLEQEGLDPELRRRLERHLAAHPLRVAERRVGESRLLRAGELFNRITVPVSRLALGGTLHPVETARAALAALLAMRSFPPITTQERQALHAYEELLEREPEAPERGWVLERVERYRRQLERARREEALELAERALEMDRSDVALAHLERAARGGGSDAELDETRAHAERASASREQRIAATFAVTAAPLPLAAARGERLGSLARDILIGHPLRIAAAARAARERGDWGPLDDELAFLAAFEPLEAGDHDAFLRALERVARLDPARSNMARHARWILDDPEQNPYAQYAAARAADRRARIGWLLLGRRARGPLERSLPRPLEWLIDVPGLVASLFTLPLRAVQYGGSRGGFGADVIHAGERYLARFPEGARAPEVRRELEGLYAARGDWSHALAHHGRGPDANEETALRYRERVAERTLAAAELHPRVDVRASIYRSIDAEYPETPQAARAREALRELLESATPQEIRVSREFLEEHPALWAPGALGLRPELLDGDASNGELAEAGVTLLGQTLVRVELVDREPRIGELTPEAFARFIALLEEASYSALATDERERPEPDLQRDWFFERARLGLLDAPDLRPGATSRAVFLGSVEKHGAVRTRESILPVELVLQGGLDDFGVAAFPRVRTPRETPDAFLFR